MQHEYRCKEKNCPVFQMSGIVLPIFLLSSLKCVNMNYALFESLRPSVSAVLF